MTTATNYSADDTALTIVDPYNDFMSEVGKFEGHIDVWRNKTIEKNAQSVIWHITKLEHIQVKDTREMSASPKELTGHILINSIILKRVANTNPYQC
jgi:hypothetical protein